MDLYGLIVTIIAMLGVIVFILLFERQRARRIERDLQEMWRRPGRDQRRDERTR